MHDSPHIRYQRLERGARDRGMLPAQHNNFSDMLCARALKMNGWNEDCHHQMVLATAEYVSTSWHCKSSLAHVGGILELLQGFHIPLSSGKAF